MVLCVCVCVHRPTTARRSAEPPLHSRCISLSGEGNECAVSSSAVCLVTDVKATRYKASALGFKAKVKRSMQIFLVLRPWPDIHELRG